MVRCVAGSISQRRHFARTMTETADQKENMKTLCMCRAPIRVFPRDRTETRGAYTILGSRGLMINDLARVQFIPMIWFGDAGVVYTGGSCSSLCWPGRTESSVDDGCCVLPLTVGECTKVCSTFICGRA